MTGHQFNKVLKRLNEINKELDIILRFFESEKIITHNGKVAFIPKTKSKTKNK